MMETSPAAGLESKAGLERYETAIAILAFAAYILERCAAFFILQNRAGSGGDLESQLLEFFFGQTPHSVLDVLLGFGPPEALREILNPRNILQAVLQGLHFLANWWIVSLPFRMYAGWKSRNRE
jgi:hypothetical protein